MPCSVSREHHDHKVDDATIGKRPAGAPSPPPTYARLGLRYGTTASRAAAQNAATQSSICW